MKVLTFEEEVAILQELVNHEPIGVGSSRATYHYQLGKVVKVAISNHGVLQNQTEVQRYAEFSDKNILSQIYAYGKLIIVAEEVRLLEYYDYESEDERNEIAGYVEGLRTQYLELVDESIDGEQVGFNQNGLIVFYDYGYVYQRSGQVGVMDQWNDELNVADYAIDILNGRESFKYSYEEEEYEEEEEEDNPYNHFSQCKCYACEEEGINGHQEEVSSDKKLHNLAENYASASLVYKVAVDAGNKFLLKFLKNAVGYEGDYYDFEVSTLDSETLKKYQEVYSIALELKLKIYDELIAEYKERAKNNG
jgi:hypothetical protein